LPVFYCCNYWEKDIRFKPVIEKLIEEVSQLVKISFISESNNADKQLLAQLIQNSNFQCQEILPIVQSYIIVKCPSFVDANRFYLNRLLYGKIDISEEPYQSKIFQVLSDSCLIDNLLSALSPLNIGLDNYITGLVWGIINSETEK
jgi:hypothetical protein